MKTDMLFLADKKDMDWSLALSPYCLSVMVVDLTGRYVCFAVNVGQGFDSVFGQLVDVFVKKAVCHSILESLFHNAVGGSDKPKLIQVQYFQQILKSLLQEEKGLVFHFGYVAVIAVGLGAALAGCILNKFLNGVRLFAPDQLSGLSLGDPRIRLFLNRHLDKGLFHRLEGIVKTVFPPQCFFAGEAHAEN